MMRSIGISIAFGVALILLSAAPVARAYDVPDTNPSAPASQVFALTDTTDLLVESGVKAEAVEYKGRKAVRLTKDAVDEPALAFINGTHFRDGSIEVDREASVQINR